MLTSRRLSAIARHFGASSRESAPTASRKRSLLEQLEQRRLLATLYVYGGNSDDTITITLEEGLIAVTGAVSTSGPRDPLGLTIRVNCYNGEDTVESSSVDVPMLVYGGPGEDWISTGGGNDTLYGGMDSDTLRADGADDLLYGEDGKDDLRGALGNDT